MATHVIRPATEGDVEALLRLIRDLAVYEKLEHMAVGTPALMKSALFGPKPACEAVMLDVDGRSVGFALYFITFSTFLAKPGLYLEDLFVEPEYRGRGFGKALLRHLASICVARDYGRFEWRVLDWNEPSIQFYKSLGAKILPEWELVRMIEPEFKALAVK